MRGTEGFGLMQVMVAAAVVGIVSLNFLQKARGRAEVSMIADLMAFRDNALDYYTAVAANRAAWECLKEDNATVGNYANGISSSLASTPVSIWDSAPGFTAAGVAIPTGGCNKIVLPSAGLGMEITDDFPAYEWVQKPAPSPATLPPGRHCANHASSLTGGVDVEPGEPYFCLSAKVEGEGTAPGVKMTITIEYFPEAHRFLSIELKTRERVLFFNRTVAKNCGEGRLIGPTIQDHRGADLLPNKRSLAYLGDAAVEVLDSERKGVLCDNNPLVVPPCYDRDDDLFSLGSVSDAHGGSRTFKSAQNCSDARWQGRCPPTPPPHNGITAISEFDEDTGLSQCSVDHILVGKPDNPVCETDEQDAVTRVENTGRITDSCSYRGSVNRGGVKPKTCGSNAGIRGWQGDGDALSCKTIATGPQGIPGSDCHRLYQRELTWCCCAWYSYSCSCGLGCTTTCWACSYSGWCCSRSCPTSPCWRRGITLPDGGKRYIP